PQTSTRTAATRPVDAATTTATTAPPTPITTTSTATRASTNTAATPAPQTATTTAAPPRPSAARTNNTAPPATTTTSTTPASVASTTTAPTPPPQSPPDPVVTTEPLLAPSAIDVPTQLRAGDAAIVRSDLVAARAAYGVALSATALTHADALRLAEGLYRARDFRGVIAAFARAGTLMRGEEPYRYYLAVAYYETGQYGAAKRELASVLPFIEVTPDVAL